MCRPHSMPLITDFCLLPKRPESDHRPLIFLLTIPNKPPTDQTENTGAKMTSYKWDLSKLESYKISLQNDECKDIESLLLENVVDNNDQNIDSICEILYKLMKTAISCTFREKTQKQNTQFPQNQWFNDECKQLKQVVHEYSAAKYDFLLGLHNTYGIYTRVKFVLWLNYFC